MCLALIPAAAAPQESPEVAPEFLSAWGPGILTQGGPLDIHIGRNGFVFFSDKGFGPQVHEYTKDGTEIASWGPSGSGDGQLIWATGIATDGSDNIYVLNQSKDTVNKFDSQAGFLKKWSVWRSPISIAIDAQDRVFVGGYTRRNVSVFSNNGDLLSVWETPVGEPMSIAIEGDGNLLVCLLTGVVERRTPDGLQVGSIGKAGTEDGAFNGPQGVAVDRDGSIYVADTRNSRIQKFLPDGTFLFSLGEAGTGAGQFSFPQAVAIHPDGELYVADTQNRRIQIFGFPKETGDVTPPARIDDLSASSIEDSSFVLEWTAPGDDGTQGAALLYELRYSTSPMDSSNFEDGYRNAWVPRPSMSGTREAFTVEDIEPLTKYYVAIRAWDEAFNRATLSPITTLTTLGDITPPAAVNDLAIDVISSFEINASWTATGDDGAEGLATSQELRYSEAPLEEGNWGAASVLPLPAPKRAGDHETLNYYGLEGGKQYYFGLRVADELGNLSPISNVVFAPTPPVTVFEGDFLPSAIGRSWTYRYEDGRFEKWTVATQVSDTEYEVDALNLMDATSRTLTIYKGNGETKLHRATYDGGSILYWGGLRFLEEPLVLGKRLPFEVYMFHPPCDAHGCTTSYSKGYYTVRGEELIPVDDDTLQAIRIERYPGRTNEWYVAGVGLVRAEMSRLGLDSQLGEGFRVPFELVSDTSVPVGAMFDLRGTGRQGGVELQWLADPGGFSAFRVERMVEDAYRTVAEVHPHMDREYSWQESGLDGGTYVYRVVGLRWDGTRTELGPVSVQLDHLAPRLSFGVDRILYRTRPAEIKVGSGRSGVLTLRLFDIQGRLASDLGRYDLAPGWQSISWTPGAARGHLPAGVYFLRGVLGGESATVRIVVVP